MTEWDWPPWLEYEERLAAVYLKAQRPVRFSPAPPTARLEASPRSLRQQAAREWDPIPRTRKSSQPKG